MQSKLPILSLNQSISDVNELAETTGWGLAFRQLDPGPLLGRVVGFGHSGVRVMRVEFNRSFHQIGNAPQGVWTFGLPDKETGVLRWKGMETPPGILINFNYGDELDCVNPGPFGAYLCSFDRAVLQNVSDKLGFEPELLEKTELHRFWFPDGVEHEQLRQNFRALEKVALDDGDNGLKRWEKVINFDIAALIIQIIGRRSSTPQLAAPRFRAAAMHRAVEILHDHDQFPINIEALCTMVGASWATLQRAFAEEFGVTPSSYIKSRRLAAVQAELIEAGANGVISDIANRWGFWHMGSFASDYKKQFGELPSETLRRL